MGKEKYLKRIEALFRKSPVMDSSSIKRILSEKRDGGQYHKQLINNLVMKGRIERLAKGCYTMHDDPSLAVFCFKPAYRGLQDALSIHGLWEQETIPVIITAKKVRQGIRNILGINVLIRRLSGKYLFGFEYIQEGGFYMPVSDIEKTFIDMVYFRQVMGRSLLKSFRKRINRKKLEAYLRKYPKKTRERVRNRLQ